LDRISFSEVRSLVLEVFKNSPSTQYINVLNAVAELAVSKGVYQEDQIQIRSYGYSGNHSLQSRDQDKVREIIWNLIVENVVTIGINASNTDWPWLKLTEYGNKIVNTEMPAPHDPSGYLNRLMKDVPSVDEIIITYLTESLRGYNINLVLSSTIMLGCASEKALLLLIDSFIESHTDESRKQTLRDKFNGKMIKRQFEEFTRSLTTIKSNLTKEIEDGLNNVLFGIFEMIRNYRNDAGHPTGKVLDKEQLFANIQVFIPYLKKIYQLIDYFDNNPQ
jgi:hypothetical protein